MPESPQGGARSAGDDANRDEALFAAIVGPGWEGHYRGSFERIRHGRTTFNWSAALVPFHLAYHGIATPQVALLGLGAVLWAFSTAFVRVMSPQSPIMVALVLLAPYVLLGMIEGLAADHLMYRRAQRLIARHRASGRSDSELLEDVRQRARSTRRAAEWNVAAGFIVALIYFVFLFAGCGCNFARTRELGYRSDMKSELRNLEEWQAGYFGAFHRYSMTPGSSYRRPGAVDTVAGFRALYPVTVTMASATRTGWSATASHGSLPHVICRIAAGDTTAPVPAQPAEISCTDTHR